MKRLICMALSCMFLVGVILLPADAAEVQATPLEILEYGFANSRATGSFNWTIPAKTAAKGDIVFPLAAGETVTIKASYSPFSASVDFGLIAPDGKFYCFNITNGSIDKTIQVDDGGSYTFQVRNNYSKEVQVSGFINY